MADWKDLADLMFPDVDQTIADLEKNIHLGQMLFVLVSRLVLLDFCILVEFFQHLCLGDLYNNTIEPLY